MENETTETAELTDREMRQQLKALSTEVFGASSKYQKLFEYKHLLTVIQKEVVPGVDGAPDTEKEVEVPLLKGKAKQYVMKYRTESEVLALLLEFKAKRDAFMEQMKAQQAEQKAKNEADQLAKKLQEDLAGSALT